MAAKHKRCEFGKVTRGTRKGRCRKGPARKGHRKSRR